MTYDVRLAGGAEHDLSHIPRDVIRRIDAKLIALGRNPRPRGVVKLQGREGAGWGLESVNIASYIPWTTILVLCSCIESAPVEVLTDKL